MTKTLATKPILRVLAVLVGLSGAACIISAEKVIVHRIAVKPQLAHPAPIPVASGGSINFTPTLIQGSGVTYSATSLPTGASINSSTGAITGTLSSAGKWTTVITATNAYGSDKCWLPVSVYTSTANISQASGFPYNLNTANRKYTLTEDITSNGTALAILAANIFVDLNGHTITFDNATPITISNGSFETGTAGAATGWSFTNAAHAARFAGTYLYNEIYDGSYSLKFSTTTANEYVDSSGTITLEANTTYSLSGMFEYGGQGEWANPGVVAYIQLRGTGGETTREVTYNSTSYRGIQFKEATFKTGASAETYTVRVGITGHAAATRPMFIDDVKVQRYKCYGVATQNLSFSSENYPDLTTTGIGTNATITNGKITQGGDKASWGHGVFLQEINGVTVHGVEITTSGPNASPVLALDATTGSNNMVASCTMNANTRTITSRDNYNGCVIKGICGKVVNNVITTGCHVGIGYANNCSIVDNVIRLKAKYTNGFGISANSGSEVYRNQVLCYADDYVARGILAAGSVSNPTTVHDNEVRVRALANIQEYEGQQINGAYGIQCDTSGYVTIYSNDVYAYGIDGCDAHCLRFTELAQPVEAYTNTLYAIADNAGGHASLVSFSESDGTKLNLHDNVCQTNDGLVGASDLTLNITLTDFSITVADLITTELAYTCYDYTASGRGLHVAVTFTGTQWADAGSLTYASTSTPVFVPRFGGGNASTRMGITIE